MYTLRRLVPQRPLGNRQTPEWRDALFSRHPFGKPVYRRAAAYIDGRLPRTLPIPCVYPAGFPHRQALKIGRFSTSGTDGNRTRSLPVDSRVSIRWTSVPKMVAGGGIEPPLADLQSAALPLDDPAKCPDVWPLGEGWLFLGWFFCGPAHRDGSGGGTRTPNNRLQRPAS